MACLISRFQLYSFNKCSHWTYASTAEQAPPTYIEHTIILCIAFTNSENVHMRCFRYPGATCSMPYLAGSGPSSLEISSQGCWFVLCSKMLGLPCCWEPCLLPDPLVPCYWGPSSLLDAYDHILAQHLPPRRFY